MTLRPLLCAVALLFGGCASKEPSLPTVSHVDLDRYQGVWYEIARYENRFEKGCVGASATYERVGNKLRVTNRCFDASGTQTGEAKGTAKLANPNDTSKLKVSFFWPFYGDYWVLMLADDYRYSVVGDPKRDYFWILARDTSLDKADINTILERMPALGYDPEQLYWTRFP